MRPINLIPEEERRSGGVATRTGPVAYLIVGALGVLLIGVVMLVLFSNQVHDREGEVARLETEKAAATAQATKLAAYTNFKQVSEDRTRTVAELADARFDWVRVIRQLSLVLPDDVFFDNLGASAGGTGGSGSEVGIEGPSLQLTGCAVGQAGVAGFVAALKEIDGVTRVELNHSSIAEGSGGGSNGPCSKSGMAQFDLVVAFDGAPPSPDSASAIAEAPAAEGEGSESEGSESEGSSEGEGSSESESSEGSSTQSAAAATTGASG